MLGNFVTGVSILTPAGMLPMLADGLQVAFDPRTHGSGIVSHDLAVLAIWTLIGTRLMLKFLQQLTSRS